MRSKFRKCAILFLACACVGGAQLYATGWSIFMTATPNSDTEPVVVCKNQPLDIQFGARIDGDRPVDTTECKVVDDGMVWTPNTGNVAVPTSQPGTKTITATVAQKFHYEPKYPSTNPITCPSTQEATKSKSVTVVVLDSVSGVWTNIHTPNFTYPDLGTAAYDWTSDWPISPAEAPNHEYGWTGHMRHVGYYEVKGDKEIQTGNESSCGGTATKTVTYTKGASFGVTPVMKTFLPISASWAMTTTYTKTWSVGPTPYRAYRFEIWVPIEHVTDQQTSWSGWKTSPSGTVTDPYTMPPTFAPIGDVKLTPSDWKLDGNCCAM